MADMITGVSIVTSGRATERRTTTIPGRSLHRVFTLRA